MKTKFIQILVPFFITLTIMGCGQTAKNSKPVNTKNAVAYTDPDTNHKLAPLPETNNPQNETTEIMPSWPPSTNYRKDILNLKKRNYINATGKVAYLTIDDGPSPNTPKILAILKEKNVKATFFDIGIRIRQYPQFLKMEFDEGNAIGNHSWDHVYANIYKSPESLLDSATKANEIIEKTIGIRTPLFRAPGGTLGNFSIGSWNIMDTNNYLIYDWNVSSTDGSPVVVPKQKLVETVLYQAKYKNTTFILLHDSEAKYTTVQALPEIIDGLKKEGFSFGILSTDVQPPHFINTDKVPNSKTNSNQTKLGSN